MIHSYVSTFQQTVSLENANEELRNTIRELEEEKVRLELMLRTHDLCPRSCNTRLSHREDEDEERQPVVDCDNVQMEVTI